LNRILQVFQLDVNNAAGGNAATAGGANGGAGGADDVGQLIDLDQDEDHVPGEEGEDEHDNGRDA